VTEFSRRYQPVDTNSSAEEAPPASCPACRASAIVTTAKTPNAGSYWRCTACGEVWNDARRRTPRYGNGGWR